MASRRCCARHFDASFLDKNTADHQIGVYFQGENVVLRAARDRRPLSFAIVVRLNFWRYLVTSLRLHLSKRRCLRYLFKLVVRSRTLVLRSLVRMALAHSHHKFRLPEEDKLTTVLPTENRLTLNERYQLWLYGLKNDPATFCCDEKSYLSSRTAACLFRVVLPPLTQLKGISVTTSSWSYRPIKRNSSSRNCQRTFARTTTEFNVRTALTAELRGIS